MFLINLQSNWYLLIGFLLALVIAVSIHEFSHAWLATRLGDNTAKLDGRLTLNPLAHFDLWGTIFLFLVGFGWGKPVPVNYHHLSHPKMDNLKIALAGPLSNFLVAIFFALILRLLPLSESWLGIIFIIIQLNLTLMIFNLIPIPPLDGSNILMGLIPDEANEVIRQFSPTLLIVFLLFAFFTDYISNLISFLTHFFLRILVGI